MHRAHLRSEDFLCCRAQMNNGCSRPGCRFSCASSIFPCSSGFSVQATGWKTDEIKCWYQGLTLDGLHLLLEAIQVYFVNQMSIRHLESPRYT